MNSVPSTFVSHFRKCWWSKTWSKNGHDQGESCLQKQLSNPQKEVEINTRFQYITHIFKICKWIHLLETLFGIQHNIQKQKNGEWHWFYWRVQNQRRGQPFCSLKLLPSLQSKLRHTSVLGRATTLQPQCSGLHQEPIKTKILLELCRSQSNRKPSLCVFQQERANSYD